MAAYVTVLKKKKKAADEAILTDFGALFLLLSPCFLGPGSDVFFFIQFKF